MNLSLRPPGRPAGTVLYVEDNASNVKLMERVLSRSPGVTLLHASNGQTGLERARADRPNLILLDLHLPDCSGEDLLRFLREHQETRSIPTIILSGAARPHQIRRLLECGAADYLTKPLDVVRALAVIHQHLSAASVPPQSAHASNGESTPMTMSAMSQDPMHELNNHLAIIIGFADMLLDEIEAGDRRRPNVEQILHAAQRAMALLPQLAGRPDAAEHE